MIQNTSKLLITLAVTFCAPGSKTFAQGVKVSGIVTDKNGEALIGATVAATDDAKNGTVTDQNGRFQLTITGKSKTVTISYIGYTTSVQPITATPLKIILKENNEMLDQVVVIGYGSVKKGDVTNAISSVKGDALENRVVANAAQALQGELAGVSIQSQGGGVGSAIKVNVRGAVSINENTSSQPLYVVDGIPQDDNFDLSMINTQDIASIDVLKDASSSAIYGSRGANGVIIVTLKGGTDNGKVNVNVKANFQLASPENRYDVMSPKEWIQWRSKIIDTQYLAKFGSQGAKITDDYATRMAITGGGAVNYCKDPRWSMPNYGGLALIDWQDELYRTGFTQNYDLSVAGGSKKSNYRVSVSYLNLQGIVRETSYNKLNFRAVSSTDIGHGLTVKFDFNGQLANTHAGNSEGKDGTANAAASAVPVAEPDAGIYSGSEPYTNYAYTSASFVSPIAKLKQSTYNRENVRLQASATLQYQVYKDLKLEAMGSWGYNSNTFRRFIPSSLNRYWASYDEGYYTSANWNGSKGHRYLAQATATYRHKWGKHSINGVGGWSMEVNTGSDNYTLGATHFPNNASESFDMKDVELTSASAIFNTDTKLFSVFARAEYGYGDRYLLNASIRRDGSSKFGKNCRWGTFPAVSGAWRISNESFWGKDWLVNQAKVRASYGVNGSNAISTNAAEGLLESANYSQNGSKTNGYAVASIANNDLSWQKTHSFNVGADLGLARNRFSIAIDWYSKTIKNMLYQVSMPSIVGVNKAYSNIGSIRNTGFEIELKTENISTKDFKWTTHFNIGTNRSRVTDLGNNSAIYCGYDNKTQIIEVGHAVGEFYLYDAVGIYKNSEELAKYPRQTTSAVGGVRYRDVNEDGIINEKDRTYMGHAYPSATYGLKNTFKWKNWDASLLITAQTGGKIYGVVGRSLDRQGMLYNGNVLKKYKNMWFSESDPGDGVTPSALLTSSTEELDNRWLYSSDFLKLKNITLGYTFKFGNKAFVKTLRTMLSMENIFMIDDYDGGLSPEANTSGLSVSSYDYGASAQSRTYNLGVSVTF